MGLSRRQLLSGAASLSIIKPAEAFAVNCRGIRGSQLGVQLFHIAADKLYGDSKPEDLQKIIEADFWQPTEIEKAISLAWDEVISCKAVSAMVTEYRNGDTRNIGELVTNRGHDSESFPNAVKRAMTNYAPRAFQELLSSYGEKGRTFNDVGDRGMQAFLLNAYENPGIRQGFAAVAEIVRQSWQEGFNLFVENKLMPFLDSSAPEAAPAAGTGELKFR